MQGAVLREPLVWRWLGWARLEVTIAGYGRAVARPRLFWDGGNGRTFFATAGVTYEDRTGGTMPESVLEATGEPYEESLETRRFDSGVICLSYERA